MCPACAALQSPVRATAPADNKWPYRDPGTEPDPCGSSFRTSIRSRPCLSIDLIGRYHEASHAIILVGSRVTTRLMARSGRPYVEVRDALCGVNSRSMRRSFGPDGA